MLYNIQSLFFFPSKNKKKERKPKSMVNETLTKSLKSSVGIISII